MATRNVTLAQLISDIQFQVDQVIGTTGHTQKSNVVRLVNQSIQRFRERTVSEGITRYLVSASGTLTTGATSPFPFLSLDLSSVSPAIVRTFGIDITVNGNVVKTLSQIPFADRANYGGPTVTGEPEAWSHYQGTKLAISPAPDQPYAYTVWYLPVLADLVADADTFDGVAGWEDFIVWDVVCRLIIRDQYADAYQMASQYRDELWKDILRGAQRVSAAGGAVVGRDALGKRAPRMGSQVGVYPGSGGGGQYAPGNQGNLLYSNSGNIGADSFISTDGYAALTFMPRAPTASPGNQYLSVPTGNMFAFGFSGVDGLRISGNAAIPSNILFQALNNGGLGQPMEFLSIDRGSVASGLDVYLGNPAGVHDVNIRASRNINLTPAANVVANATTAISLTAPTISLNGAVNFSPALSGVFSNVNVSPGGRLGIAQMAFPTGFGDKLATWTPSGYANQATGIHIVASGTALAFGASPATTGAVRLSNNQTIYGRNATNSANILIATVGADNVVYLGDTVGQELDLQSSTFVDIDIAGTTNPTYRFSSSSLQMPSGAGIVMQGAGNYISMGSGPSTSTSLIHTPSNPGDIISARNYDNTGNQVILNVVGSPTFSDLHLGDSSAKGTNSNYYSAKAQHLFFLNDGASQQAKVSINGVGLTMASGTTLNSPNALKYDATTNHTFLFGGVTGMSFTPTGLDLLSIGSLESTINANGNLNVTAGGALKFRGNNGYFFYDSSGSQAQLWVDPGGKTASFGNTPTGYALNNVGTISGPDGRVRLVDWSEPLRGGMLADASVTKTVGLGNRYIMPAATLSTTRTITLIPTGATVGEVITIERLDVTANTLVVANGGPGGSGTIYTFPASTKRAADFQFASGTSWALAGHVRLS